LKGITPCPQEIENWLPISRNAAVHRFHAFYAVRSLSSPDDAPRRFGKLGGGYRFHRKYLRGVWATKSGGHVREGIHVISRRCVRPVWLHVAQTQPSSKPPATPSILASGFRTPQEGVHENSTNRLDLRGYHSNGTPGPCLHDDRSILAISKNDRRQISPSREKHPKKELRPGPPRVLHAVHKITCGG
jgi:hypothetical protein